MLLQNPNFAHLPALGATLHIGDVDWASDPRVAY